MTDPKDPTPAMDEEPEEENEEFSEEGPESAAEQDALMDAYLNNMQEAKEGEIRIGVVVAVGQDSVLINLDDKAEGIAPISDFIAPMGEITVKVGDEIEVLIQRRDTEEGQIRVSHRTAKRVKALDILADAVEKETPLTGVCSRTVKSGLIVDCGVDCFMPASQIDLRRVEKLEEWVGREIEFLVLELNRRRGRAVISRRKLMEMRRDQLRDEFLSSHGEGDVVRGVAKTVLDFGVFVDLNGIEAFIPREEISWERAASPVDYMRPGNPVEAKILKLNPESGKITLSRKRLMPDPWSTAEQRYPKGAQVTGEVAGLTKFGAFVRLEEGLTGLIHVSDLSWSSAPQRPEELLKEGDRVTVAVLELDMNRRRLSLGLKQLSDDPWSEAEAKFPPKSIVEGEVTGLTKFGAFVRLDDDIEGLIHVSDFSWEKSEKTPADFVNVGDTVKAIVLKTDKAARRISLGVKQMTPSPMESFAAKHRTGSALQGKVVSIIDSGAFLELAPGIEGFLHISQLSEEKVNKVESVCKVGETLDVKIIKMDVKGNRISLSRKALIMEEERRNVETYLRDDKEPKSGGMNLGELLQDIPLQGSK